MANIERIYMGKEKEPEKSSEVIYLTYKLFLLKLRQENPDMDISILMNIAAKLTSAIRLS
mgnify:FL=1|tara:strand:- start:1319 stop:1498 length:180 start_codon:yes stop_codon:yes gene_type:complete